MFIGMAAWASTQVSRDGGTSVRYGSLETEGWSLAAPASWTSTPIRPCEVNRLLRTGVIVTDVDFAFRDPQGGDPSCEDRFVFEGFPEDGVALSYEPTGIRNGLFPPSPDTPFPLSRQALTTTRSIGGGPAMSYSQIVIDGELIAIVRLWIGGGASDAAIDEAEEVLGSIDVAGAVHWHTHREDEHRLSVTLPDDWVFAESNLTPWLTSPAEILSLGTFRLRASPDPTIGLRLFDAPVAPTALADMKAIDAFISVQESGPAGGSAIRPRTFRPDGCVDSLLGCDREDDPIEVPFQAWWIPFDEDGRGFYLFVAIGNEAPPELVDQTWAIADSLRFSSS